MTLVPEETVESDYYTFMGFDPAAARSGLSHYVQYFTGPVLELACGRGEFLDVLAEAGIEARGVDLDSGMVAAARARGHDVLLGDAIATLEAAEQGSYDGVFAAHFVEHLGPDDVLRLLRAAARALRPGGRVVLATPNAASLSVMGHDFWKDPTHLRFYDPELLRFLCARAGLTPEETGANPRNDAGPPPGLAGPAPLTVNPDLDAAIVEAVTAAAKHAKVKDPAYDVGHLLGHLLGVVAERLQRAEQTVADLQQAHAHLLRRLYPANEVYVVARA
jgi:O-antigen chain-terminating methyltransferase